MTKSRTSLNKPFYDWIKSVKEADKKIEELEDKLYYYEVKLIGYNSPNFEPRLSSTKPEYKDNRYYWIDKISQIESQIKTQNKLKAQYATLVTKLNLNEKNILDELIFNSNATMNLSKSYKYFILNKIARIFKNT